MPLPFMVLVLKLKKLWSVSTWVVDWAVEKSEQMTRELGLNVIENLDIGE